MSEPKYSGELSFLNKISTRGQKGYRHASWLKSDYESSVWEVVFADHRRMEWSFGVDLYDGSSLLEPRHAELLDTFKQWLCIQTHSVATSAAMVHPTTAKHRVSRTLHLIDYILLNGQSLQLAVHGLRLLSRNDIRLLVAALSSSSDISFALYGWPERLSKYLIQESESVNDLQVAAIMAEASDIANIDDDQPHMLSLTEEQTIKARVWLWQNGCINAHQTGSDYVYRPNTSKLAAAIYKNTLWGSQNRQNPPELCFGSADYNVREKKRVPVREFDDPRPSTRSVGAYLEVLRSLKIVVFQNGQAQLEPFAVLDSEDSLQHVDLKILGRYRTLPEAVVMTAIRGAIEFSLLHGEEILDGYLRLYSKVKSSGAPFASIAFGPKFQEVLTPHLRSIGIQRWAIKKPQGSAVGIEIKTAEYFARFRQNQGLYELLKVLMGATAVLVNALMARRSGELKDLRPGRCLDNSGRYLLFKNRKSGISVHRMEEARPIPPIAAQMIRTLERFHSDLRKIDPGLRELPLFCYPVWSTGELAYGSSVMYSAIDSFCDYFELPGDADDNRFYLRGHQMRRFFAIAFFWGSGFGGLDTLRWFLGHLDPEHLWNYITESVPGEVLQAVSADFAVDSVRRGAPEAEALGEILFSKFGTREFSLLDSEELAIYVEELLVEGAVEVKPHFFSTDSGQQFRVLITVTRERDVTSA